MPQSVESLSTLNSIPINESREPLVNLAIYCPKLIIRSGINPLAREGVAIRLNKVLVKVPEEYNLFLARAIRTVSEQKQRYDAYFLQLQREHPSWPNSILKRETNRFFAPYDQPTPPGHTTGGAVDVYLIDKNGNPIDQPPPLEDWSLGYTHSSKVDTSIQLLRKTLCNLMEEEGFSNYPKEYWHYSYGDNAWAARHGKPHAIYGICPEANDLDNTPSTTNS